MTYGSLYSYLPHKILEKISHNKLNKLPYFSICLYLKIFGYPDIASHMRYRLLINKLFINSRDKLLDMGSGNGIYSNQLSYLYNIHVSGIEGRKERVLQSRLISRSLSLKSNFFQKNLESIKLIKSKFDIIICLEVLEHIVRDERLIEEMIKALKIGGKLIITVPWCGKDGKTIQYKQFNQYEHVRNGYTLNYFKVVAKKYSLNIKVLRLYFLFFTKKMVKIQQYMYTHMHPIYNLLSHPILLLISYLDYVLPLNSTARGIFVVLEKEK